MAISFVSNALGGTTTTTSFSITLPTTQAGDIIILEFAHRGTGNGTIGGTYSGPAFTHKHNQPFATSTFSGNTWYSRATGNHSGETVTGSGLTNSCAAIVTIYRGARNTGDPLAAATVVGEQNASGNETQAQITTTRNNAYVVLVVVNSPDVTVSTQSCTSPGTLAERAERLSTGGTDTAVVHASEELPTAGATGAFTWAQSNAASGSWAYAIEAQIDASGAATLPGLNAAGSAFASQIVSYERHGTGTDVGTAPSSTNRILFVIANNETASVTLSTLTVGGQAMTKIDEDTAGNNYSAIWRAGEAEIAAMSGSTLSPTWAGTPTSPNYQWIWLSNVSQVTPIFDIDVTTDAGGGATSLEIPSIDTVLGGLTVVAVHHSGGTQLEYGDGVTELLQDILANHTDGIGVKISDGSPIAVSVTFPGAGRYIAYAINFQPLFNTATGSPSLPGLNASGSGGSGVLFDSSAISSGDETDVTSSTHSHTIGDYPNRKLLVWVFLSDDGAPTESSSVTFNGDPLSLVHREFRDSSGRPTLELWEMDSPDVGTFDVVVTPSQEVENLKVVSVSAFCIDSAIQIKDFDFANASSGTSSALTVDADDDGLLSNAIIGWSAVNPVVGANQTQIANGQTAASAGLGYISDYAVSRQNGSQGGEMSWTFSSQPWAHIAVSLAREVEGFTATGSPSLPNLTASGTAVQTQTATGATTLPGLNAAGNALQIQTASGSPSLPSLSAARTGISFVGENVGQSNTLTEPSGVQQGDYMIAILVTLSASTTLDGWTQIGTQSQEGSVYCYSFYIVRGASPPDLTFLWGGGGAWAVVAYRNVQGVGEIDEIEASSVSPSVLIEGAGDWLICLVGDEVPNIEGVPDGMTVRSGADEWFTGIADEIPGIGETGTRAWNVSSGTPIAAYSIVLIGNTPNSGEVTGENPEATGSPSLPNLTAAGTALQTQTATGAATLPGLTASGTALQTQSATGATTLPGLNAAGTGVLVPSATGAATLPNLTATGTALQTQTATGACALPNLTASGTALHTQTATGAPSLPNLTASGVGVMLPSATGAATLPNLTASGTALQTQTSTGAVTLPNLTATGVGVHSQTATGAATLPNLTASGTALQTQTATGVCTLPGLNSSGTALQTQTSTGVCTLPSLTCASEGEVESNDVTGTATCTLPSLTASGTALQTQTATGTCTLPNLTCSGSATQTQTATGAVTLPGLNASGQAVMVPSGTAACTLPGLNASGQAVHEQTATGSVTLPSLLASGSALQTQTATGTCTLPNLTCSGTGVMVPSATGACTLPNLVCSGTAIQTQTSTGACSLPSLVCSGTGVQTQSATGACSLPSLTCSGTGVLVPSATGTCTLPGLNCSGTAVQTQTATGVCTLPSLVCSGQAIFGDAATGIGTCTLPSLTCDADGEVSPTATGAATLPSLVASGSATQTQTATGACTLPSLTADADGEVIEATVATGACTLPSLIASGSATQTQTATGSATLPSLQSQGSAAHTQSSTGACTLPGLTCSGTGTVGDATGTGSSTLPSITCLSDAEVRQLAVALVILPSLLADGIGHAEADVDGAAVVLLPMLVAIAAGVIVPPVVIVAIEDGCVENEDMINPDTWLDNQFPSGFETTPDDAPDPSGYISPPETAPPPSGFFPPRSRRS